MPDQTKLLAFELQNLLGAQVDSTLKAFGVSPISLTTPPPAVPTFYEYVMGALMADQPDFLVPLAFMGQLAQIVPQDDVYVAHILQHAATMDSGAEEPVHLMSLVISAFVVDLTVNSGVLQAQDHLMFGRTTAGILTDVVFFVLQDA